MIEKEAADTVIAKIEEVAAQAAPHIQDFAGDAVGYLVLKQVAMTVFLLLCTVAAWVICKKAIRQGGAAEDDMVGGISYGIGVVFGIGGLACTVATLETSVNTLAALIYPQIFAVEKLLGWLN